MPKQKNPRILTGLLIGFAILFCIYMGPGATSKLLMIIAIMGAFELSMMFNRSKSMVINYLHVAFAVLPFFLFNYFVKDQSLLLPISLFSCGVMLLLIGNLYVEKKINYDKFSIPLVTIYWGLPFALGSNFLMTTGEKAHFILLGIILLIWTSDTMAYVVGKNFGKNKLFPSVSPGKTIEGSLGAGLFSVLFSLPIAYGLGESYWKWIVIGIVVWILGTFGDLVESKMKRVAGVKDSGKLLPGHGGFLDRFDSLVMVIPFLVAIYVLTLK